MSIPATSIHPSHLTPPTEVDWTCSLTSEEAGQWRHAMAAMASCRSGHLRGGDRRDPEATPRRVHRTPRIPLLLPDGTAPPQKPSCVHTVRARARRASWRRQGQRRAPHASALLHLAPRVPPASPQRPRAPQPPSVNPTTPYRLQCTCPCSPYAMANRARHRSSRATSAPPDQPTTSAAPPSFQRPPRHLQTDPASLLPPLRHRAMEHRKLHPL